MSVNWSYRVEGDDATRIATVYDQAGALIETRPYTEREHQAADQRVEIAARVTGLEERVLRLETLLLEHEPDPTDPEDPSVLDWEDLPRGLWFHDTLVRDGGAVWRNVSGTPLSERPTKFPGGPSHWTHLFVKVVEATDPPPDPDPDPDPEPEPEPDPTHPEGYVGPWSATANYEIGDVCDRDGRYYRCRVAHGPEYEGTWGPPQASVWDDIGPYPPE